MELKKQIPIDNFENFENLKKDLIILLGFYNVWLEFLLESLAARKTFLHIYTESNNFLFFQEKIFENILSLDQINHTLATDLLTFRKNYAELCRMMPKTE